MKHRISQMYDILTELPGSGVLPFIGKLERDLAIKLDQRQMIEAVHNYASDI